MFAPQQEERVVVLGQWMLQTYDWRQKQIPRPLEEKDGGSVAFGDNRKSLIKRASKISKSNSTQIENVYYVKRVET